MFNNLLKPTIFISKQFKNLFIKRVILYVASLGIMLVYKLTISSEYKLGSLSKIMSLVSWIKFWESFI